MKETECVKSITGAIEKQIRLTNDNIRVITLI